MNTLCEYCLPINSVVASRHAIMLCTDEAIPCLQLLMPCFKLLWLCCRQLLRILNCVSALRLPHLPTPQHLLLLADTGRVKHNQNHHNSLSWSFLGSKQSVITDLPLHRNAKRACSASKVHWLNFDYLLFLPQSCRLRGEASAC